MVPVSREVSTPGKNSLFQLPLPDPSILILNPSKKMSIPTGYRSRME